MTVVIGHVGDSRAYLVRGDTMEQLTDDHSLVNELMKSGKLSEEEAQIHPQRSVITRAVGTDPDVDVDSFTIEADEGDIFLICSDGLTDMVDDEEILALVHRNRDDLEQAVKALVSAANRGGGEDNITAVAFRMAADPATSLEDTVSMPAIDAEEPDEETREYVEQDEPAAEADSAAPAPDARRVRIVLLALVLLGIAAALIVWRLLR
jgi:protein phosphatase